MSDRRTPELGQPFAGGVVVAIDLDRRIAYVAPNDGRPLYEHRLQECQRVPYGGPGRSSSSYSPTPSRSGRPSGGRKVEVET